MTERLDHFVRVQLADGERLYARLAGDTLHVLAAPPWVSTSETGRRLPATGTRRLAPVEPSKIIGIGRNYREHAKEMGAAVPTAPLMFLKAPSSLLDPEGVIELPPESAAVEHEAELGVVIGKRARRVPASEAMAHVLGYTAVGDITARDLQRADGQWARAKSFDTFCPVGPVLVGGLDPAALDVQARVNGAVRQSGNTRDMIFGVADLVSYASAAMTLEPGDLIATGTPAGVGPLASGDTLEIEVGQIGVLRVSVRRHG